MCVKEFVKKAIMAALLLISGWQYSHAQLVPALTPPGMPLSLSTLPLQVTGNQTSSLVFAAPIKSVDRGSSAIVCKTIKGIDNVLKVKARDSAFVPTNLTVYTDDGMIYNFEVRYNPNPEFLVLSFGPLDMRGSTVHFSGSEHTDTDIRLLADSLAATRGFRFHPRAKVVSGMHLFMNGAYLSGDLLLIQYRVANHSRVRYDIDFIHYYVRDRHQQKRTIHMEKEIKPLYVAYSGPVQIENRKYITVVAAFEKFTIADNKLFVTEVYERNGDRRLICKMKGRHLLQVLPIKVVPKLQ